MPFKNVSLLRNSSFPWISLCVNGMGENPKHGTPNTLKNLISVQAGHIVGLSLMCLKE